MSQYEIATERLVAVIHSIKLGQRSGELTVWRGEGRMREEGTVVFVSGQMTEAAVGRRSGLTAFNHLCTWGYCHYTFLPLAPGETRGVTEQLPAATGTFAEAWQPRVPETEALARGQIASPEVLFPPPQRIEEKNSHVARQEFGADRIVPRSTGPLHDVLRLINQHQLSRSHRQLFLLIDGQHSLTELMYLMRRNDNEIRTLLRDLEHLGVIDLGGN